MKILITFNSLSKYNISLTLLIENSKVTEKRQFFDKWYGYLYNDSRKGYIETILPKNQQSLGAWSYSDIY